MNKKIVIFHDFEASSPNMDQLVENFCNVMTSKKISFEFYDNKKQKDLNYFIKNKDNRIFVGVIDYCIKNKVDFLFFPLFLYSQEFLLSEIDYRKELKTKISFGSDWRLLGMSGSRVNIIKKLLKKKQIKNIIVYSIAGKDSIGNNFIKESGIYKSKKIKPVMEPLNFKANIVEKKSARKKLGLNDKFVVLFFGSMGYGKGLDILLKAAKILINEPITFLVAANTGSQNYNMDMDLLKGNNIKWINRFIENDEVGDVCGASDMAVLPYRKTYEYGSSGVMTLMCQHHVPIMVPNFYPFSDVMNKYKLGEITNSSDFESEQVLADEIMNMKKTLDGKIFEFDDFLTNKPTWEKHVEMILK